MLLMDDERKQPVRTGVIHILIQNSIRERSPIFTRDAVAQESSDNVSPSVIGCLSEEVGKPYISPSRLLTSIQSAVSDLCGDHSDEIDCEIE